MALPERERESVDHLLAELCGHRIALYREEQVELKYVVSGNKVTLVESRPFFVDPRVWNHIKVAQFEFSPLSGTWTLYWYDRKNRRQPYPTGRNRDALEKLVDEVSKDPTGIFWE